MSEIIELIKEIPKSELHMHIEGSLEPELMFKMAERNNISIPFKILMKLSQHIILIIFNHFWMFIITDLKF